MLLAVNQKIRFESVMCLVYLALWYKGLLRRTVSPKIRVRCPCSVANILPLQFLAENCEGTAIPKRFATP